MLETTIFIDLLKESKRRRPGPATRKLKELTDRGEVWQIAIFTLAELFVGVAKGSQPRQERAAIEQCVSAFAILPFERSTAEIFGTIVGILETRGETISDYGCTHRQCRPGTGRVRRHAQSATFSASSGTEGGRLLISNKHAGRRDRRAATPCGLYRATAA